MLTNLLNINLQWLHTYLCTSEKHNCIKTTGTVYHGPTLIIKDYLQCYMLCHILYLRSISKIYISYSQSSSKLWRQIICKDTSWNPKQMRMNALFSFGKNCHSLQWKDINKYTSNYIRSHRAGSHKMNMSF